MRKLLVFKAEYSHMENYGVTTITFFLSLKPKFSEQLGPAKYFWVWKIEEK
jgi:hypothetical protein